MTEYKKEAPNLNEEGGCEPRTIEHFLAEIVYEINTIALCWPKESEEYTDSIYEYVRKIWDLVPEEKE